MTAATEPNHRFVAFTTGSYPSMWSKIHGSTYDTGLSHLAISPRQRLDDVVKSITDIPFGGTDCALPMLYASEKGLKVDAFVVMAARRSRPRNHASATASSDSSPAQIDRS